jgi:xanthine dehydrogenase accessory factor
MAGELYDQLRQALRASEPVVMATIIVGPSPQLGMTMLVRPGIAHADPPGSAHADPPGSAHVRPGSAHADPPVVTGSLGDPELDRVVERDALGELEVGRTGTRHYGPRGEARGTELSVFIESFAPPPRMIIFGAVDFTAALGRVAKILGYHVTVCDPRPVFATATRFPMADELVVDWPNRYLEKVGPDLGPRDAACVLTHDAKLDVPAITAALATRVGYLGVMGNRRTHTERMARLREAGVDDAGLARLMAPIGLDIGSRTPEETALSICAEIIALRTGHDAPSLRDRGGPIHARTEVDSAP